MTPSKEELRAAVDINSHSHNASPYCSKCALVGEIIAAQTRHEGETSAYWHHRFKMEKASREAAEAALNQERAKHHVQYHSALNELAKAQARVKELEQMPCDSTQANEWLNANAPTNVLQSLWAWRRIAEDGLALRDKRIAGLVAAAVECGDVLKVVGNPRCLSAREADKIDAALVPNVQADTREQSR
jgi:hypothetical protein